MKVRSYGSAIAIGEDPLRLVLSQISLPFHLGFIQDSAINLRPAWCRDLLLCANFILTASDIFFTSVCMVHGSGPLLHMAVPTPRYFTCSELHFVNYLPPLA